MFTYYMGNALLAALHSMPGSSEAEHGADDVLGYMMLLNPGYWILHVYAALFFRVTSGFSRLREVMADQKAIQLCGSSAFRNALLKVGLNDLVFEEAIQRGYARSVLRGGAVASNCSGLIHTFYTNAEPATLRRMQRALLLQEKPETYDSHPPVQMRLDYAAQMADSAAGSAAPVGSTEPVAVLFDEWDSIHEQMTDRLNRRLLAYAEEA
jgi:Zn-dependent protease with chaperone function